MRRTLKLLSIAFILATSISSVSATTIDSEEVTVDLENSEVEAVLEVEEFNSDTFTYFTSFPVNSLDASLNGDTAECETESSAIGAEVRCSIGDVEEFTLLLDMEGSQLTQSENSRETFIYSKNFIRPTNNFSLTAVLPEGHVLVDDEDATVPPYSPQDAEVGSTGQRITVQWNMNPSLGESSVFRTVYEPTSGPATAVWVALVTGGVLILLTGGVILFYIVFLRENIETVYDDVGEDAVEMLELIRENDGSMLQKDIVNEMEYSKAKISGMTSDLVEREILKKQKEGRSNKLSISRKYRG